MRATQYILLVDFMELNFHSLLLALWLIVTVKSSQLKKIRVCICYRNIAENVIHYINMGYKLFLLDLAPAEKFYPFKNWQASRFLIMRTMPFITFSFLPWMPGISEPVLKLNRSDYITFTKVSLLFLSNFITPNFVFVFSWPLYYVWLHLWNILEITKL